MDLDKQYYDNALRFIMDKKMSSQEEHCTCVPILKRRIEELEKKLVEFEGKDFWTNWVYPEGANPEQIQNELLDFHFLMEQVPLVYMEVTNGRISKPNTYAREVIAEFEYFYEPSKNNKYYEEAGDEEEES